MRWLCIITRRFWQISQSMFKMHVCVQVSRRALRLMAQIEHEPLLNIHALNPDLFDHADVMSRVQELRQQLRFLGDYLRICRSDISKQIQPRCGSVCVGCVGFCTHYLVFAVVIWWESVCYRLQQRTYLLENSDVYSVLDLQQVSPSVLFVIREISLELHNKLLKAPLFFLL